MEDLELIEGPPRIFIPICKDPLCFQIVCGPVGWEEVEEIKDCPILISKDGNNASQ